MADLNMNNSGIDSKMAHQSNGAQGCQMPDLSSGVKNHKRRI
jgi:hypothetical protein